MYLTLSEEWMGWGGEYMEGMEGEEGVGAWIGMNNEKKLLSFKKNLKKGKK